MLASNLDLESFGQLNLINSVFAMVAMMAPLGAGPVLVRNYIQSQAKNEVIGQAVLFISINLIILCLMSFWIIEFLNIDQSRFSFYILALCLSTMGVFRMLSDVRAEAEGTLSVFAAVMLIIGLFGFIAKVVVIRLGYEILEGLSIIICLETLFILCVVVFYESYRSRLRLSVSLRKLIDLYSAALPLAISAISVALYMRLDTLIVGYFLTEDKVSIYVVASRLIEISYLVPMAAVLFDYKDMVVCQKNHEAFGVLFRERLGRTIRWTVIFFVASAVPVYSLVYWLLDPQYLDALMLYAIFGINVVSVCFGIYGSKWIYLRLGGRFIMYRQVEGLILNGAVSLSLVSTLGIIGVAIGTVLSQLYVGLVADLVRRQTFELWLLKIRALRGCAW